MTDRLARIARLLRLYTPRRLYNAAMAEVSMRLGWSRAPFRPTKITIEPGNVCNLKCPLCPTGQPDNPMKVGMLDMDLYRRMVDQVHRDVVLIRLYNWGEPLLHPDIIPMIEYASARNVEVRLSLNLNILKPGQADAIMRGRIEKIFVSCDGTTQDTYQRYRVGGNIDTVFENMRELMAARVRHKNRTARIIWLFHVFRHNQHQVDDARRMAREMGVELRVDLARTDMGREIFETPEQARERDGHWLPSIDQYNIFAEGTVPREYPPCKSPWREVTFNWDGSVLPCCAVPGTQLGFGNVGEEDFADIWNNEKYRRSRQEILGRRENAGTVCHTCRLGGYRFAG